MEDQVQQQNQDPIPQPIATVHQSSRSKWFLYVLIFIVVVLTGLCGKYIFDQQKLKSIIDFQSCKKAENPVTTSYPAQCRTSDGRTFVQQLKLEDQKKLQPPSSAFDEIIKTFPKGLTWKEPSRSAITYFSYDKNHNPTTYNLTGYLKSGTGVDTTGNEFTSRPEDASYLTKNGWENDSNQAADGPTGSLWGYKRKIDGKYQILQLRMHKISGLNLSADPGLRCPCDTEYSLFLSDPFRK